VSALTRLALIATGETSANYTLSGFADGPEYLLGIILQGVWTDQITSSKSAKFLIGGFSDGHGPLCFGGAGTPERITVSGANVTGKSFQLLDLYPYPISDTYDVDANGIPEFVTADYIELGKISRISKFRSGRGHDYSDDFESCRSMKHYFKPKDDIDWSTIKIFSPAKGTISQISNDTWGQQVKIKSEQYPAFYFIIFHVNLTNPLNAGDIVTAGQQLGTHVGSQTESDIAVGVNTPNGWKLVSYFNVMTDSLFQGYKDRGLSLRTDAIISKAARDADPLTCSGETFVTSGNLENWVTLN
jgi:hypothetical protein